jgi:hypothetical protein
MCDWCLCILENGLFETIYSFFVMKSIGPDQTSVEPRLRKVLARTDFALEGPKVVWIAIIAVMTM